MKQSIKNAANAGLDASIDALANTAINGNFGNGAARQNALGSGYNAVQNRVNEILGDPTRYLIEGIAAENEQQAEAQPQSQENQSAFGEALVNALVNALANTTIEGYFGNGVTRQNALGTAYIPAQNRVNEILGDPTRHPLG